MEDKKQKALSYFNNSFNCAQSVLVSFGTELGLSEDECLKLATAFGAGMAKHQYTCGAVTGALMVLGLKYGKALNDPENNKVDTYDTASDFLKQFENKNGSIICKDLLKGLNMNNDADLEKINKLGLFENECENYIQSSVEIVEKIFKSKK